MEVLADHFGTSTATCSNTLKNYFPLLQKDLAELGVLPVREWKDAADYINYMKNNKLTRLTVDATERKYHRNKDKTKRKKRYSGKKKEQTLKNTLLSDSKKYIHFLGKTIDGSIHD